MIASLSLSLCQVPSFAAVSVSTMIKSIDELKHTISNTNVCLSKPIDSLLRSLGNLNHYVTIKPNIKNEHLLNLAPLVSLNHSIKSGANQISMTLVREQADRLLTMIKNNLYQFYEKVAFCELQEEIHPRHVEDFEQIRPQITQLDSWNQLRLCSNYIEFQYENHCPLTGLLYRSWRLIQLIVVDRTRGYFVQDRLVGKSSLDTADEKAEHILIKSYQFNGRGLSTWTDAHHQHVYYHDCQKVEIRLMTKLNDKSWFFLRRENGSLIKVWPPPTWSTLCTSLTSQMTEKSSTVTMNCSVHSKPNTVHH